MSYQVLARKYRPRSFTELVGQEHVSRALTHALDQDRLHHAYLFTGTRGCGKTTIARILAKCLNCEQGVSSHPCGTCSACREINEGRFVDLIEVDAASRTKVEDTRELLDNVQYAPTRGRYKVYLIDEVHMLSTHSFNALLKTLEEPPPHVKFLLATTDPQKLPITVLSRCLQFSLKALPADRIASHLAVLLEQEMIRFEPDSLQALGRTARGSMRDALSLTDQAIAFSNEHLTQSAVSQMLGTVDRDHVIQLLHALATAEPAGVLNTLDQIAEHSPDETALLDELIQALHRLAVAQVVPERERDPAMAALAAAFQAEQVQLFYDVAVRGRRDLPDVPDPRAGLEMVLLRMLVFRPDGVYSQGGDAPPKKPSEPAPQSGAGGVPDLQALLSTAPSPAPLPTATAVVEPRQKAVADAGEAAPPAALNLSNTPQRSAASETVTVVEENQAFGETDAAQVAPSASVPAPPPVSPSQGQDPSASTAGPLGASGAGASTEKVPPAPAADDSLPQQRAAAPLQSAPVAVATESSTPAATTESGMPAAVERSAAPVTPMAPNSGYQEAPPPDWDDVPPWEDAPAAWVDDPAPAALPTPEPAASAAPVATAQVGPVAAVVQSEPSHAAPAVVSSPMPQAPLPEPGGAPAAAEAPDSARAALERALRGDITPLPLSDAPQAPAELPEPPPRDGRARLPSDLPDDHPASEWARLVVQLDLEGVTLNLACNCALAGQQGEHWQLLIARGHQVLASRERVQELEDALARHLQRPARVDIEIRETVGDTPDDLTRRYRAERLDAARTAILADTTIQTLVQQFDGRLDLESIDPLD
ncbi:DNA polymerase III subunit gamma/tau [Isoalcanivorax beigongshangi]|uniref:DNA-directed DNA polymerase n=1 Tax=Isoalcanivorax beigongshangi TaxID=3238810 RepID=A0ABV4AHX4_9GAMM